MTSAGAPTWYTTMQPNMLNFVVLDFLPDQLPLATLPLSLISSTSTSVTKTVSPGASITSLPKSTSSPASTMTRTSKSTPAVSGSSSVPSSDQTANYNTNQTLLIVLGTLLPLFFLAAVVAIYLYWRRRNQRRRPDYNAPPIDHERALGRWSGSVFSTNSQPSTSHGQAPPIPLTLPELTVISTHGFAFPEQMKVSQAGHELEQVTIHEADSTRNEIVEEPRPGSVMSIRQVQKEDMETPKKKRISWRLSRS